MALFMSGAIRSPRFVLALLSLLFATPLVCGAEAVSYEDYLDRRIVIEVPAGNRNVVRPAFKESKTLRLMRAARGISTDEAIESKYQHALRSLRARPEVFRLINRIAPLYGVRPVHVLGAIVGEHTFNVSIVDDVQKYALYMHRKWIEQYENNEHKIVDILRYPEFAGCDVPDSSDYEYWDCVSQVWQANFRGRIRYGKSFPDKNLVMTFFNPFGVGKTYGLGQMGPLTALRVTDVVHQIAGLPLLDPENISEVYRAILDMESSIHYIAANISVGIRLYRDIAGFDISGNPGVTATLYNLGAEKWRAYESYRLNLRRLKNHEPVQYPAENHYGWLVNERRAALEALLDIH